MGSKPTRRLDYAILKFTSSAPALDYAIINYVAHTHDNGMRNAYNVIAILEVVCDATTKNGRVMKI